MRIEEGSLLERLNQKRERRLSIIFAFRIFSLFTGCLQTCDYHRLDLLICSSYQATPAWTGLKPLKNTLLRFMYCSPRLAAATRPRQLLVFSWTRSPLFTVLVYQA